MAVKIEYTNEGSAAHEHNLSGCTLVSINGNDINDMFDYEFYTKCENLEIAVIRSGENEVLTVQKGEYDPLGCEFETYLMDEHHTCKNKCIFCFVDQIPKGLRSDLYFKDDDERLSFLFGNYITLTNLSQKEVKRIIEMNISPVNISVHTVNPKLRVEMMKNPNSGEVLQYIDEFNKADVSMNFQLVLCPGINDGEFLIESLEKLGAYYPNVQSIAAVPVGLTKYRQNLTPLVPYDEKSAKKQLDIMLEYGEKFLNKYGTRLIYPSDEWFLLAKMQIPDYNFYEDYPQLENGVGMFRRLFDEFCEELKYQKRPLFKKSVDIVTGEITSELAHELCGKLQEKFTNVHIKIHTVKNLFFGGNVNVTGLLTGEDIISAVKGKLISKTLLLPENITRDSFDVLLDNITVSDIEKALGVKVKLLPQDGAQALRVILGKKE